MSAWSVKTRRDPSRHCRDAMVCDHTTTVMHDNEYTRQHLPCFQVGTPKTSPAQSRPTRPQAWHAKQTHSSKISTYLAERIVTILVICYTGSERRNTYIHRNLKKESLELDATWSNLSRVNEQTLPETQPFSPCETPGLARAPNSPPARASCSHCKTSPENWKCSHRCTWFP